MVKGVICGSASIFKLPIALNRQQMQSGLPFMSATARTLQSVRFTGRNGTFLFFDVFNLIQKNRFLRFFVCTVVVFHPIAEGRCNLICCGSSNLPQTNEWQAQFQMNKVRPDTKSRPVQRSLHIFSSQRRSGVRIHILRSTFSNNVKREEMRK